MALATLFQNLHQHLMVDNGADFAESVALWDAITQLRILDFDESGEKLKEIIESSYTDGIDGFESVKVSNGKITGIFIDVVSPSLTKRYQFTVTPNNISYTPINGDEIEAADFAATDRKRNCTKGFPCGGTCLPLKTKSGKKTNCNYETAPAQKQNIETLIEKGGALVRVSGALAKQGGAKSEDSKKQVARDKDGYRIRTNASGKRLDTKKLLKDKASKLNKEIQKNQKAFDKLKGEDKERMRRKLSSQRTALFKLVDMSRELEKPTIRFDNSDLKTLGLKGSPTEEEITKAYRNISMKHHPDITRNKSPQEQAKSTALFREATEAYKRMKEKYAN